MFHVQRVRKVLNFDMANSWDLANIVRWWWGRRSTATCRWCISKCSRYPEKRKKLSWVKRQFRLRDEVPRDGLLQENNNSIIWTIFKIWAGIFRKVKISNRGADWSRLKRHFKVICKLWGHIESCILPHSAQRKPPSYRMAGGVVLKADL